MATGSPRTSTLKNTSNIVDNNSNLFNGWLAVRVVPPRYAGGAGFTYDYVFIANTLPPVRMPDWYWVKITDGLIDTTHKLIVNADLVPVGSTYQAYIFDIYRHEIPLQAGSARYTLNFTLTTAPYNVVVGALASLSAPASTPTPQPATEHP